MTRPLYAFLALLTCGILACSATRRTSSTPHSGGAEAPKAAPTRAAGDQTTIVLVVRHTEKANLTDRNTNLDPDLDKVGIGVTRAEGLRQRAVAEGVSIVYTSEYCRTAQTVQPSALALGLGLHVLSDTRDFSTLVGCTPPIVAAPIQPVPIPFDDVTAISHAIRTLHVGQTVLIASHSNLVPGIVEALSGRPLCPEFFPLRNGVCEIPEEQFGDMFRVAIPPAPEKPSLTHVRF